MEEKKKGPGQEVVETLLVLRPHRARPAGKLETKKFKPGDRYEQSGLDKLQVLAGENPYCTRDLKADVPENTKRKAPKDPKIVKDPLTVLIEQVGKLTEAVDKLVAKK